MPDLDLEQYSYAGVISSSSNNHSSQEGSSKQLIINGDVADEATTTLAGSSSNLAMTPIAQLIDGMFEPVKNQTASSVASNSGSQPNPVSAFDSTLPDLNLNPFLIGVKPESQRGLFDRLYFFIKGNDWKQNFEIFHEQFSDFNKFICQFKDPFFQNQEYIKEKNKQIDDLKKEKQKLDAEYAALKSKDPSVEKLRKFTERLQKAKDARDQIIQKLEEEKKQIENNGLDFKARELASKGLSTASAGVDAKITEPEFNADAPAVFSQWRLSYHLDNASTNSSKKAGFRAVHDKQSFRGLARVANTIPILRQHVLGLDPTKPNLKDTIKQDRPNKMLRKIASWFGMPEAVINREKVYQARKSIVRNWSVQLENYNRGVILEMFERLGEYLSDVGCRDEKTENTPAAYIRHIQAYMSSPAFKKSQEQLNQIFMRNKSDILKRGEDLFYLTIAEPDFSKRVKLTEDQKKQQIQSGKKRYISYDDSKFDQTKNLINKALDSCNQKLKNGSVVFSAEKFESFIKGKLTQEQLKLLDQKVGDKKKSFVSFLIEVFKAKMNDQSISGKDALINSIKACPEISSNTPLNRLVQPIVDVLIEQGIRLSAQAKMEDSSNDRNQVIHYGQYDFLNEKIKNNDSSEEFDYQTLKEDLELLHKQNNFLSCDYIAKLISERIQSQIQDNDTSNEIKAKTASYLKYWSCLIGVEQKREADRKKLAATKKVSSNVSNVNQSLQKTSREIELENMKQTAVFFEKLYSSRLHELSNDVVERHLNDIKKVKFQGLTEEDVFTILLHEYKREMNNILKPDSRLSNQAPVDKKQLRREPIRHKAKNIVLLKGFINKLRDGASQKDKYDNKINQLEGLKLEQAKRTSLYCSQLFGMAANSDGSREHLRRFIFEIEGRADIPQLTIAEEIQTLDSKLVNRFVALMLHSELFNALIDEVYHYINNTYTGSDMNLALTIRLLETVSPQHFGIGKNQDGTDRESIIFLYGKKRLDYLFKSNFSDFDMGEPSENSKEFIFPKQDDSKSLDLSFFQDVIYCKQDVNQTWKINELEENAFNDKLQAHFRNKLSEYLQGNQIEEAFKKIGAPANFSRVRKLWFLYETYADDLTLQAFRIRFLDQLLSLKPNSPYLKIFLGFYKKSGVDATVKLDILTEKNVNPDGSEEIITKEFLSSKFVTDEKLKKELVSVLEKYLPDLNLATFDEQKNELQNQNQHLVFEGVSPDMAAAYRVERLKLAYFVFKNILSDIAALDLTDLDAENKKREIEQYQKQIKELWAGLRKNYVEIYQNLNTQEAFVTQFNDRLKIEDEDRLLTHDSCNVSDMDTQKTVLKKDWEKFCENTIIELRGNPQLWCREYALLLKQYAPTELLGKYLATQLGHVLRAENFAQSKQFLEDLKTIFGVNQNADLLENISKIAASDVFKEQFSDFIKDGETKANASFIYLFNWLQRNESSSIKANPILVQFHLKRTAEIFDLFSTATKEDLKIRGFDVDEEKRKKELEEFSNDYIKDEFNFYQDLQSDQKKTEFNLFFGSPEDETLKKQLSAYAGFLFPECIRQDEESLVRGWRISLLEWFNKRAGEDPVTNKYLIDRARYKAVDQSVNSFARELQQTFESDVDDRKTNAFSKYQFELANEKNVGKIISKPILSSADVTNLAASSLQSGSGSSSLKTSHEDGFIKLNQYENEIIFQLLSFRAVPTEAEINDEVREELYSEQQIIFEKENKARVGIFLKSLASALPDLVYPRRLELDFKAHIESQILKEGKNCTEMRKELGESVQGFSDEDVLTALIKKRVKKAKTQKLIGQSDYEKFCESHKKDFDQNKEKYLHFAWMAWYARCQIILKFKTWKDISACYQGGFDQESNKQFMSLFDKCLKEHYKDEKMNEGTNRLDFEAVFQNFKVKEMQQWENALKEFKITKISNEKDISDSVKKQKIVEIKNAPVDLMDLYAFVYSLARNSFNHYLNTQTSLLDERVNTAHAKVGNTEKMNAESRVLKIKKAKIQKGKEKFLEEMSQIDWISQDKKVMALLLLRNDWVDDSRKLLANERAAILRLILEHRPIFTYICDHQFDDAIFDILHKAIYSDFNLYAGKNSLCPLTQAFDLRALGISDWKEFASVMLARTKAGIYAEKQILALNEKLENSLKNIYQKYFSFIFESDSSHAKPEPLLISKDEILELKALQEMLQAFNPEVISNQEEMMKSGCQKVCISLEKWISDMQMDGKTYADAEWIVFQNQIQYLDLFGSADQKQGLINALPPEYFDLNSNIYKHKPCGQRLALIHAMVERWGKEDQKEFFKKTPYLNLYQELDTVLKGCFVLDQDQKTCRLGEAIIEIKTKGTSDQSTKLNTLPENLKNIIQNLVKQFNLDSEKIANADRDSCFSVMNGFLSSIKGVELRGKNKKGDITVWDAKEWQGVRAAIERGDKAHLFSCLANLFVHAYQFLLLAIEAKDAALLKYFDTWFSNVLNAIDDTLNIPKKGSMICSSRLAFVVVDFFLNGSGADAKFIDIGDSTQFKFENISKNAVTEKNKKIWKPLSLEFVAKLNGKILFSESEAEESLLSAPTTTASPYAGHSSMRNIGSLSRASSQSVISPKLNTTGASSQTSESPKMSSPSQAVVPGQMNASSQISTPNSQGSFDADNKEQSLQTPEAPTTPKSPSNLPPIRRNNIPYDRKAQAGNRMSLMSKVGLGVPTPNQSLSPSSAGAGAAVSPPSSTLSSSIVASSSGSKNSAGSASASNKASSPTLEKISSPDPVKENTVNGSSATSSTSSTSSTNYSFANFFSGGAPHPLNVTSPSGNEILFPKDKEENEIKKVTSSESISPNSRSSSASIAIPRRQFMGSGRGMLTGSSQHDGQEDDSSNSFGQNPSAENSGLSGYRGGNHEKRPSYSPNSH